jgi:acyl-CoA thioesterase I
MRLSRSRSLVYLLGLGFALVPLACAPSDVPGDGDEGSRARATGAGTAATDTALAARDAEDGRPVVVFLGTSLTAGLGLPTDDDTYVAQSAELAEAEGVPFRPVNAGVSGETSAAGLRRLDWVLRQPLDVLVLELGANDGLRGLDPEELRANLAEIVRRTRETHPEAVVVLAGMEAPPNLGSTYTEAFKDVFADVAEGGALLVPFLLEGVAGERDLNQSDGIHPTAEGHRRMARNLWPVLRAALDSVGVRR